MNKLSKIRMKLFLKLMSIIVMAPPLLAQTTGASKPKTVDSDWAVALPLPTVLEMLKSKNFALRVPKNTFDYSQQSPGQNVQSSVKGMSFQAGMSISTAQFAQNGEVSVTADLQGLGVSIDEVNFKLAVEIAPAPGAAPVSTKIEGTCQNVEALFVLPIKIDMKASFNEADQKFSITSWSWNIADVNYSWISSKCDGPGGISEFLRQRVFQKFVTSEQAKTYVIQQSQEFLNHSISSVMERLFSQSFFDAQLDFHVEKLKWSASQFNFEGRLRLTSGDGCLAFQLATGQKRIPLDANVKAAIMVKQMAFPEDLMLRNIQCAHERGLISFNGTTADIPDFKTLMENRTNQSYAWPDLGRFPTSQIFLMKTKTTDKLSMTSQQVSAGYQAQVTGQITSYWSSNSGPYVTFWTPLSATAKVNVVGDKLEFSMSAAKSVKVAYRFDQKVTDNFIDTSYFNQPVTDYMSKVSKSWSLPKFELPNQRKVTISALKVTAGKGWTFTLKD